MSIEMTNCNENGSKKNEHILTDGDWLRSFKGCEHYSDDEAKDIVESLEILATILLENAAQRMQKGNNICISIDEQTNKIAA